MKETKCTQKDAERLVFIDQNISNQNSVKLPSRAGAKNTSEKGRIVKSWGKL